MVIDDWHTCAMISSLQQTVVVAALTYKRPDMLIQLLDALLLLEHPAGWEVSFLIVDNDAEASARPIVESFAARFAPHRLDYAVEPEPGIPAARNRALEVAIARGARLLAFIDDDEHPDTRWLRELVAEFQATGAVLIGGPVPLLPPDFPTTLWQGLVARSLLARSSFLDNHSARRARRGNIMVVGTGNWMADLDWIRAQGLRFDAGLQFSGGSDTAFLLAVQARGGKVSWAERAVAYEAMPRERLSIRYQFSRSKAQAKVLARLQGEPPLRMCLRHAGRLSVGLGLLVIPVFGWASPTIGVHMIGAAFGRFSSLYGAQSQLYQR
jgi:succinoglycan biosynthesis protein ExoM